MESKQALIGPPRLTRFEKARIIGARALQIALGAPVLIRPPKGVNRPVDIAMLEFEKGVLPITVRRKLPDGTYVDLPLRALLEAERRAEKGAR